MTTLEEVMKYVNLVNIYFRDLPKQKPGLVDFGFEVKYPWGSKNPKIFAILKMAADPFICFRANLGLHPKIVQALMKNFGAKWFDVLKGQLSIHLHSRNIMFMFEKKGPGVALFLFSYKQDLDQQEFFSCLNRLYHETALTAMICDQMANLGGKSYGQAISKLNGLHYS